MHGDDQTAWLDEVSPDEMRRIVDALYRVHQLSTAITDMRTVLGRIMEESLHLAMAEACSVLLYDERTDELYFFETLASGGDQEALKRAIRLKLGEGIAGAAAQNRESIIVNDAESDTRVFRAADAISKLHTESILAVPMIRETQLVGVIEVINKTGSPFSKSDQRILEVFASLAAGVILSARLVEENIRSERLAAVGHTVAGLSHHTKNVLAGLQGSMELIDEGLASENMPIVRQGWNILKRSAERLSMVVFDMLAYAKEREAFLAPCDLRPMISEIVDSFSLLFARKDATFKVNLEQLPNSVLADIEAMHKAVLNLINNAGDAIPDKGGSLMLQTFVNDTDGLVIEVHDNGPGIKDSDAERIFDPFFSTKGAGGTGIGLAVTSKIVKEHGGVIGVTKSPLGGACFTIKIPQNGARHVG